MASQPPRFESAGCVSNLPTEARGPLHPVSGGMALLPVSPAPSPTRQEDLLSMACLLDGNGLPPEAIARLVLRLAENQPAAAGLKILHVQPPGIFAGP